MLLFKKLSPFYPSTFSPLTHSLTPNSLYNLVTYVYYCTKTTQLKPFLWNCHLFTAKSVPFRVLSLFKLHAATKITDYFLHYFLLYLPWESLVFPTDLFKYSWGLVWALLNLVVKLHCICLLFYLLNKRMSFLGGEKLDLISLYMLSSTYTSSRKKMNECWMNKWMTPQLKVFPKMPYLDLPSISKKSYTFIFYNFHTEGSKVPMQL